MAILKEENLEEDKVEIKLEINTENYQTQRGQTSKFSEAGVEASMAVNDMVKMKTVTIQVVDTKKGEEVGITITIIEMIYIYYHY